MTAEIAICNANGIALAADSAVSMLNGDKIYNSANKLFSLSKHHPVAIMVYNSASLLDVPWEVIIKQYRKKLAAKQFATLQQYCNDFWSFIADNKDWFPESRINEGIEFKYRTVLLSISEQFICALNQSGIDLRDPEIKEVAKLASSVITQTLNDYDSRDFAIGYDKSDITTALKKYSDIFTKAAEETLEKLNDFLDKSDMENLRKLCATSLTKDLFSIYSGVVIAGYGESEILPKIASYNVGIFANEKLRYSFQRQLSNVEDDAFYPSIYPFAQDDVVRSFISGIDPELDIYIETLIDELPNIAGLLPEHALATNEKAKDIIRYRIEEVASNILGEYRSVKEELGRQPLLQMLNLLPKDELAEMAESLINLTAFKRRMSTSKESVGGPIDVAILSKGDGLIWIKRKHYFKPELNQHFFHNYFLENGHV